MARTGKVAVSITADPSGLERGLRGAEGDLKRFGTRGSQSLAGLKTAAMGAGAALTTGLVVGIKQSIDAAVDAEKAQKALETQLKASGFSYKAHASEIDAVIQKTSRLAAVDDEDLQRAFTNVVRSSGSVNKSLKQMGLVADLARAKNIDVAKAGEIVGKVMSGNTGILGRYGIKLKDGATATEAMGELHKRFAGQAETYGKTTEGSAKKFSLALEELKETAGAKLLPILTKVADKATHFVRQMQSGKGAGGEFVKTLKDIYNAVKPVVEFFTKHPKYIAVAIGAWAAYKVAAKGASIYAKAQMLSIFRGQALAAQTAAAGAAGATTGKSFGGKAASFAGKALRAFGWAGIGLAIANLLGLDKHITRQFDEAFGDAKTKLEEGLEDIANKVGNAARDAATDAFTPPVDTRQPGPKGFGTGTGRRPGSTGQGQKGPTAGASSVRRGGSTRASVSSRRGGSPRASAASGNSGIVALGQQLQSEGYIVGEHPSFGGVAPVHSTNSYHYQGMAIDVNGGPGGEPGSLDALNARLAGRPGVVELLWRVEDHYDHLHVAVSGSTNPLTGAPAGNLSGGTSSAPAAPKPPTKAEKQAGRLDAITGRIDMIDLRQRAGQFGAGRADQLTVATINAALQRDAKDDNYLSTRGELELRATRRETRADISGRRREARQQTRRTARTRDQQIRGGFRAAQHWVYNQYVAKMTRVDEFEAAGQISAEQARQLRIALIDQALNNTGFAQGRMKMTPHERRLVLADAAEIMRTDAATAAEAAEAAADVATDDSGSADVQAQLDQANLRATVAQATANIAGAELSTFQGAGSIGYGGPVIVFKVGETEFARAAVKSLNSQPAITTSRTAMGV